MVMYNLLTPLTRVRLSKHYTTKTTTIYVQIIAYPRDLINKFRLNTEINDFSLSIDWRKSPILTEWTIQILTVCALRMLGKILFVTDIGELPIDGL